MDVKGTEDLASSWKNDPCWLLYDFSFFSRPVLRDTQLYKDGLLQEHPRPGLPEQSGQPPALLQWSEYCQFPMMPLNPGETDGVPGVPRPFAGAECPALSGLGPVQFFFETS